MSSLLVQKYLNEISRIRQASGSERESVVREAFKDLLKDWGRAKGLQFVAEHKHVTAMGENRYVDGALVEAQMRLPVGYWEAKDTNDDLDAEIAKKFRRGYPQDNIIFEDTRVAVLYQDKKEITRASLTDPEQIERLVTKFFAYEPEVIHKFRDAVAKFKDDIPAVLETLRKAITEAEAKNAKFKQAEIKFLKHAQETINPSVTPDDVREMLIQHILTEEIFSQVFDTSDFHHNNNVAKELYALEETFFTGGVKHATLDKLRPYYTAIRSAAALVSSHQEKQKFLKVIYENFYKVYNRKAADRLGVAYTPNEIVRFMIESADWLCQKHFGKNLIDKNVEILDPATGTGTFIVDLLEHFRGQPEKLKYKYLHELHANEVAILPYYVANLNIEATYAAIMEEYVEFPSLCFVDTLDNVAGLRSHGVGKGQHYGDLLGGVSAENVARIKRQNARKISVVIGNPPYNANQMNENENNKNREYPEIDRRIKETFIAASTAQKTKVYDMYARFFRWAADRIERDGIVAFVTNRSFCDSRTFDGFRRVVADEFSEIYVVDLGGDVRTDPRLSGTKNNVFGIQTGVAISLLVRRANRGRCRIYYARRPQSETAEEKLAFLQSAEIAKIAFDEIVPNTKNDWLNLTNNDFETFLPIADKQLKVAGTSIQERAIFRLFSLGVSTSRDDWVYGETEVEVRTKTDHLIGAYNADLDRLSRDNSEYDVNKLDYSIKWTRAVKSDLQSGVVYKFGQGSLAKASYRPFFKRLLHFNGRLVEVQYQQTRLFGNSGEFENATIVLTDAGSQKDFMSLVDEI